MATAISKLDPQAYNLESFRDLLDTRQRIIGEDPGSYESFHAGMMQSLAPAVPYEYVIAENLIAIERELQQHQRMRDANLRALTRQAVVAAIFKSHKETHETYWGEHWDEESEKHTDAGLSEWEWEEKISFDEPAAWAEGEALARDLVSEDHEAQVKACEKITAHGMDPVLVMSEAYRTSDTAVTHHDMKITDLERRRRDVKRDYDLLQNNRPVDATFIDASPIDEVEVQP